MGNAHSTNRGIKHMSFFRTTPASESSHAALPFDGCRTQPNPRMQTWAVHTMSIEG